MSDHEHDWVSYDTSYKAGGWIGRICVVCSEEDVDPDVKDATIAHLSAQLEEIRDWVGLHRQDQKQRWVNVSWDALDNLAAILSNAEQSNIERGIQQAKDGDVVEYEAGHFNALRSRPLLKSVTEEVIVSADAYKRRLGELAAARAEIDRLSALIEEARAKARASLRLSYETNGNSPQLTVGLFDILTILDMTGTHPSREFPSYPTNNTK